MEYERLYISYGGMLEPLGQSQVLAYLKRLTTGRGIHLISFEKADDWANTTERAHCGRGHRLAPAALSQAAFGMGHCLRHRGKPVAGGAAPAAHRA